MGKLSRILVPTDFSPTCDRALARAADIAERTGAELHVVHVQVLHRNKYGWAAMPNIEDVEKIIAEQCRNDLDRAVQNIRTPVVHEVVQDLKAPEPIVHYAKVHKIDLIVMGTHARKGIKRMFLGSVTAAVLRESPVSVLVIGPEHAPRVGGYRRILAPVDFSESSIAALRQASAIAGQHKASLVAMHVVEPPKAVPYVGMVESPEEFRDRAIESLAELLDGIDLPQPPEQRLVVFGVPDAKIATYARKHAVDMIVMGTVGLSGLSRVLLGSTTERVVRNAPCGVLAHRGEVISNL